MSQSIDLTPEERAKLVAERASVKYGPYASLHEAYGVLAEELWELGQVPGAAYGFPEVHHVAQRFLHANDAIRFVQMCRFLIEGIKIELVRPDLPSGWEIEAIDVMAVCQRIIDQYGGES